MKYAITPARMREAEQTAFAAGVPSLLLMETAARAAFDALRGLLPAGGRAVFLCGPGNNGGDGLAMARMWHLAGGKAQIVLPQPPQTANAQTNLRYAQALGIAIKTDSAGLDRPDALVDALFGTGFHGALAENSAAGELVSWANAQDCPILAVDIPSGMDGLSGAVAGACVRASETVTFHCAKRGLLLTAHPELVGRLIVADIGLPPEQAGLAYAEADDLALLLPPRRQNAHKGDCGRVLVFAGSEGMAGAASMAALACLRAGSGLVTVLCPRDIIPILQKTAPNAMCCAAEEHPDLPHDVLLAGCGLAETEETWAELLRLSAAGKPAVWDAGALNLLARHPQPLGERAFITPHVGEAARLLGTSTTEVLADLPEAARRLSQKYACNVALKSAVTAICTADGQQALNVVGTPALAKGGSGDALAGILASLLGQGLTPLAAMQAACLWHGLAGRLAAARYGVRSALTGEVIDMLGEAENGR